MVALGQDSGRVEISEVGEKRGDVWASTAGLNSKPEVGIELFSLTLRRYKKLGRMHFCENRTNLVVGRHGFIRRDAQLAPNWADASVPELNVITSTQTPPSSDISTASIQKSIDSSGLKKFLLCRQRTTPPIIGGLDTEKERGAHQIIYAISTCIVVLPT